MNTLILKHEVLATSLDFSEDSFMVYLNDGRRITIPLAWYPRLHHASRDERKSYEFIGAGEGIHWPRLDEDISVEALLSGRRSHETQNALKKWLQRRRKK